MRGRGRKLALRTRRGDRQRVHAERGRRGVTLGHGARNETVSRYVLRARRFRLYACARFALHYKPLCITQYSIHVLSYVTKDVYIIGRRLTECARK